MMMAIMTVCDDDDADDGDGGGDGDASIDNGSGNVEGNVFARSQ